MMDLTNKRSQGNRFELRAEEIDRITQELSEKLSHEPIDRRDAIRLSLILEETMLKYRDRLPEDSSASLRFSRSFGAFRISFKVEGESIDPFTEDDPSVTSVMGSLLSNSDTLNRSWKYRNGANMVSFTVMRKKRMSQILTILIGVASGILYDFRSFYFNWQYN